MHKQLVNYVFATEVTYLFKIEYRFLPFINSNFIVKRAYECVHKYVVARLYQLKKIILSFITYFLLIVVCWMFNLYNSFYKYNSFI